MRPAAIVILAGLLAAVGGCGPAVEADAVDVYAPIEIAAQADVASPEASLTATGEISPNIDVSSATSQPASIDAAGDQAAGRDTKRTAVNVNVSGSAWPLIASGCILVALIFAVIYLRSRQDAKDARQTASRVTYQAAEDVGRVEQDLESVEDNAAAVAKAISKLRPGRSRDALLTMIKGYLPDCRSWDHLLNRRGVRVCRTNKGKPEAAATTATGSTERTKA